MDYLIAVIVVAYIGVVNVALARFIYVQHKKTRKDIQEVKTKLTNIRKRQQNG